MSTASGGASRDDLEEGELQDDSEPEEIARISSNKTPASNLTTNPTEVNSVNNCKPESGTLNHNKLHISDVSKYNCDEKHKIFQKKFAWFKLRNKNCKQLRMPTQKYMLDARKVKDKIEPESSFEELLEQYKKIKCELNNFDRQDANNAVSKPQPQKSKSSKSDENTSGKAAKRKQPNQKKKGNRKKRRVAPQGKQLSPCKEHNELVVNNLSSLGILGKKGACKLADEEDEEELELRRLALESAVKLKDTVDEIPIDVNIKNSEYSLLHDAKRNISRCLRQVTIVSSADLEKNIDNYDVVEMDLGSDANDSDIETADNMPLLRDDQFSSDIIASDDEDEEILRANLLMSLVKHSNKDELVDSDSIADVVLSGKQASINANESSPSHKVQLPKTATNNMDVLPTPRVIINLAEDSSESDDDASDTDPSANKVSNEDITASIDAFIKDARQNSQTMPSENVTPHAVRQLSKSQQLEYYRLKAYIAKREKVVPKASAVTTASEVDQSENQIKVLKIQQQLKSYELLMKKNRLKLNQDQQRLKVLKTNLNKVKSDYVASQTKVALLKQQLANADKSSILLKLKLTKAKLQMSTIQTSLNKKSSVSRSLNLKCQTLNQQLADLKKDVSIPNDKVDDKQSANAIGKMKAVIEKERLRNLEAQMINKLEELRKKMAFKQKAENLNNQKAKASPRKRRKSLLEINPTTTPKLDAANTKPDSQPDNTLKAQPVNDAPTLTIKNLNQAKISRIKEIVKDLFGASERLKLRGKLPKQKLSARKNVRILRGKYEPYVSPLLALKSYRLNSYFQQMAGGHASSQLCNSVDYRKIMCRFELMGICNDDQCRWQHKSHYAMSLNDYLVDLVSYKSIDDPSISDNNAAQSYCNGIINTSQLSQANFQQNCLILVDHINKTTANEPKSSVLLEPRKWQPKFQANQNDATDQSVRYDSKYEPRQLGDLFVDTVDARYFSKDDDSISAFETAVLDDPTNVQLWLKLSQHHFLNRNIDNNLECALNALSRGLEYNRSSSEMWIQYLNLYSRWPSNDIESLCEKATQYAPDYNIWLKYLHTTKERWKKQQICDDMINMLKSSESNSELRSQQILQVIMYKAQLNLLCGHQSSVSHIMENTLGISDDSGQPPLCSVLALEDLCSLWICYIHFIEFNSFPADLFNEYDDNAMLLIGSNKCMINWGAHSKLIAPVDRLLDYFKKSLNQCIKKAKRNHAKINDYMPLYINLINLELHRKKKNSALKICNQLLKVSPDCIHIWLFLILISADCTSIADTINSSEIFIYNNLPYLYPQVNPSSSSKAIMELYQKAIKSAKNSALITHLVASIFKHDKEAATNILTDFMCESTGISADKQHQAIKAFRKNLRLSPWQHKAEESDHDMAKQDVYSLLNYCLYMELNKESVAEVMEIYESAVWAVQKPFELSKIWSQYLNYVIQKTEGKDDLYDLFKQCLMSVPVNETLNCGRAVKDFSFHNQIIDLFIATIPDDHIKVNTYHQLIGMFPSNIALVTRSLSYFISIKDRSSAKYVIDFYTKRNVPVVAFWKMAIHLSYSNFPKMVGQLFKTAVSILPYSISLWKDYLLFEASEGHLEKVENLMADCAKFGIDVREFLEICEKKDDEKLPGNESITT